MANFLVQGQITRTVSGPIRFIIGLIREFMITYILTKIGADWSIFVDYIQSHIQQIFQIQGQITPDVLVQLDPKSKSSETLWAYILWPSLVLIGQYLQVLECKQSQMWQIF